MGVDLVLTDSDGTKIAVQCKGYEGTVDHKAVQEVVAGMKAHDCSQTCVITNSLYTEHAQTLAAKNDCEMIDGDRIAEMIEAFERAKNVLRI